MAVVIRWWLEVAAVKENKEEQRWLVVATAVLNVGIKRKRGRRGRRLEEGVMVTGITVERGRGLKVEEKQSERWRIFCLHRRRRTTYGGVSGRCFEEVDGVGGTVAIEQRSSMREAKGGENKRRNREKQGKFRDCGQVFCRLWWRGCSVVAKGVEEKEKEREEENC